MAKRVTVKKLMRAYLDKNAHDRLINAGDGWADVEMGFYFPEDEDAVNLCALTVLAQALAGDGTTVTNSVRKHVKDLINTDTVTDKAISIIWMATFQPTPVP